MNLKEDWQVRTLVFGALIGLLTGVGAAFILIKRAETENVKPEITPGEGVSIGLALLGILRLVSALGSGK